MKYHFELDFKLSAGQDLEEVVGRLGEAGCTDATPGIGVAGEIALTFTREAPSAQQAITSAIADVKRAVPDAELIEAGPDLVGLTDIAQFVSVTRQNMRKLMLNNRNDFPAPVHGGTTMIWHLAPVLEWLLARGYSIEPGLIDVARMTRQVNLVKELQNLEPTLENRLRALLAPPKHVRESKESAPAARRSDVPRAAQAR
ncbi:MAG TPA: DNA-binding protein [Steroidobacter sp.]